MLSSTKFCLLLLASMASIASSASLIRASTTPCLCDTCDAYIKTLRSAVIQWDGTVYGSTNSQYAESAAEECLKKATTCYTNTSTPASMTSAQASSCVQWLNGTLEPDINAMLQSYESRKSSWQSSGLISIVRTNLKNLKNLTDAVGANLTVHTPAGQQASVQTVLNLIDKDYNSAIAFFA